MISLSFIYANVVISRCRLRIIVDFPPLSRRRDDCYIARILLSRVIIFYITFRVTSRVTLSSFIIIMFVISKNSLIIVIFF